MLKDNKLKITITIVIILNLLTGCNKKPDMYEMDATEKYFAENYPELEITWINTNKTNFNIKYENTGNDDRYIVNYVKDGLYYPLVINKKSGEVIKTEFISVILNGSKIFFDQDPIIDSDRVLVPLRAIIEAIGAELTWSEGGEVTVLKGGSKIELTIGEKQAFLNGKKCDLDVPAQIISGRTLVPVRFISQCLYYNVEWNPDTDCNHISVIIRLM